MFCLSISHSVVFDSSYPFIKVGCKKSYNHDNFVTTHIYRFKTNKAAYICEVEEYLNFIFVIKFYRKCDRLSENKYQILTNEFNCTRIVATCINILHSILKQIDNASFGFMGANTVTKTEKEDKVNTIRFRTYKSAMENLVGDRVFTHAMDVKHSTYLMINKKNIKEDDFLIEAKLMFENIFPTLENDY